MKSKSKFIIEDFPGQYDDKGHRLPRLYREIQMFQLVLWRILGYILKFDTSFVECERALRRFPRLTYPSIQTRGHRSHRLTRHDIHEGLNRLINAVDIINKRIEAQLKSQAFLL